MQSWFYRIGESLYNNDQDGFLSEMAYSFGLGALTGIEIAEAPGNIPPVAGSCLNSAQISIGQGEVLVTPLQVAAFFAALANGGTLYRPALVESLSTVTGEKTYTFTPDLQGELPISEKTLAALAEGLRMVVEEQRGTAYGTPAGSGNPGFGKNRHSGNAQRDIARLVCRLHPGQRPRSPRYRRGGPAGERR